MDSTSRHQNQKSIANFCPAKIFLHKSKYLRLHPHIDLSLSTISRCQSFAAIMAPISLSDIITALPSEDSWGPPTTSETTLNGVPYAPYSKGDKLGRMADWTAEGKDGRDGRGGRQQYNRNYRGATYTTKFVYHLIAIYLRKIGEIWFLCANIFLCNRSTSLRCWNFLIIRSSTR